MITQMIKWRFVACVCQVYEDEVYKICLHYSKDADIAKDLTQKTFFRIYEQYDTIKPGRMRGYVIRTAKDITREWIRDFKLLREDEINDTNEEQLRTLCMEDMYIREEESFLAWELSNSILSQLYEKNKRWYQIVLMAYYFGISQKEIARRLRVDEEVVSSRLYRAKQWICSNYQEEYEDYIRKTEG